MEDGKVIIKKIIVDDSVENGENRNVSKSEPPTLSDDINMLVTSMIHKEDGSTFARVSFLREKDWAEGIVPGGRIEKFEGFNEEEIEKLEAYLVGEEEMILQQAKGVNPLRNLFNMS